MKNRFRVSVFILLSLFSVSAFATKKLVFIGDSLTEGYGVDKDAAFPALIEAQLKSEKRDWSVVNAGISGSTSASAPARMKWVLKSHPDLIVLALGANDALRGLKVQETQKNLAQALELAKLEKVKVVVAGMLAPPNYGKQYTKEFAEIYPYLALQSGAKLLPFLLEGVAGHPDLNQTDGIHPNEKGHRIVATLVYNSIKEFL
jgi:acyl-CoA thioesterase-1